jgi:hypothetical protein
MKFQDFLAHHGMNRNPFSEEDAQTDPVFKDHCITSTFHPSWDKIFGSPEDPSTSIVFGEKGSGKTALRLQMQEYISQHNRQFPKQRCFVISYDDFNPFLDEFQTRQRWASKKADRVLRDFQLWDHMDAILSVAVTQLLDLLFKSRNPELLRPAEVPYAFERDYRKRLRKHQCRDLILLAALYDNSKAASLRARWRQLQFRLGEWNGGTWIMLLVGILGTSAIIFLVSTLSVSEVDGAPQRNVLQHLSQFRWLYLPLLIGVWIPWLWRTFSRSWLAWKIHRGIRVLRRRVGHTARSLMSMSANQLADQPLPTAPRTDDRYALLGKFQSILEALGFCGIIVLVDRLDEPHLVNGSAEAMKALLWPMLDNKFLRQPGLGVKFLLPAELAPFVDRESSDFYQRARLDKQNLVPSLSWTGSSLLDMTNARMAACATRQPAPRLADLLDETLTESRVIEALESLHVPRHVSKFLYRVISAHCNAHSEAAPLYRVPANLFESELAVFRRDLQAAARGLASG